MLEYCTEPLTNARNGIHEEETHDDRCCISRISRCRAYLHPYSGNVSLDNPSRDESLRDNKGEAAATKALAANQGLYNGFLAAGLIWGLVHPNELTGRSIELFFLVCVLIAALYGGATAKKSIWLVQGLPALIAFVFVLIQH